MRMTSRSATLIALAGLLAACSDGAGPGRSAQVTFNLASGRAPVAAPLALLGDTLASATDTIVLDTVQLVLRDIKFKRVDESACDGETDDSVMPAGLHPADGGHGDGGSDDGHDGHSDACESFNAGPYLLDVPLDTAVTKAFAVAVDTGTFDQVRIKLHKPEDDSADARDAAFLAAHPEFNKVSIRVTGSFNGTPFVFMSDLNAEERFALVPPLVVADSVTNVDVTIRVDVSHWFSDPAGGLVDPASGNKGGINAALVKDNIRDSFHAFRDDNRDGEDDAHEGHH
jgi:hypothetical protein